MSEFNDQNPHVFRPLASIVLRNKRFGRIRLRQLAVKDVKAIESDLAEGLSSREFVTRMVHRQLISPELSVDVIAQWKDALVKRVAVKLIVADDEKFDSSSLTSLDYDAIREMVKARLDHWRNSLSESLKGVRMVNLVPDGFVADLLSPFRDLVNDLAERNRAALQETLQALDVSSISTGILQDVDTVPRSLGGPIFLEAFAEAARSSVSSGLTNVANFDLSTKLLVDSFDFSVLAQLQEPLQKSVTDFFTNFAELDIGHTRFIESIRREHNLLQVMPPALLELPTIHRWVTAYSGANWLRAIKHQDKDAGLDQLHDLAEYEAIGKLREELVVFHPELLHMWDGAIMAMRSKNPDRVRHVSASVRELAKKILDKLAPTAEANRWFNECSQALEVSHITKQWKIRVLYVCRNVPSVEFVHFVNRAVRALSDNFVRLNASTHGVNDETDQQELVALAYDMGRSLYMLLTIHHYPNLPPRPSDR
jgi:hypothetical protein